MAKAKAARKVTHKAPRRQSRLRQFALGLTLLILLAAVGDQAYSAWRLQHLALPPVSTPAPAAPKAAAISPNTPGAVTKIVQVSEYTPAAVLALAKQNYGTEVSASPYAVTQVLFTYTSIGADNKPITVYARAYIPNRANAPVFALAPGTTGIGDQCAASLEQPATRNWGNYESDMMAYASQGYAGVITDYEGMRDPNSIHHYMVGALEGHAVLDSIRALENLPQAHGDINTNQAFVAGYSQGGQAAFWADALNASYAPDVHLAGVIGWGPVMDVNESLSDITKGSTLDWFGPYVLVSYADYYKTSFPLSNILLPQWIPNLDADVLGHCIDTDISFWGTNPSKVYTPQFIAALRAGSLPADQFGQLGAEMQDNMVGNATTSTPKLINQGQQDNVILPAQQTAAMTRLCASSKGPAALKLYDKTTHYTVMHNSFQDTLAWMSEAAHHSSTVPDTCT